LQYFPKTEKYISLNMGKDDEELVKKRMELRERIKANLLAAAAAGLDLEGSSSLTRFNIHVFLGLLYSTM
jgi:hypothetical protein